VPFLYFCWKSLTLRVGDTWPMFLWPAGFAAAAINLAILPREDWPEWIIQSTWWWARVAVISGIAFVVGVFFYYVAAPWNLIGRTDPVGGEAGYGQVAARVRNELKDGIEHSKASPENGDENDFAAQLKSARGRKRCPDARRLDRKGTGCLVEHERGDLAEDAPEFLRTGPFVAET